MATRVALYLRVSTARQAEHDLSIPDQRRQGIAHCGSKDWEVVCEYEERGASATTDRRPEFQRMVEDACSAEKPFDVILVHSYSRFARSVVDAAIYEKQLRNKGVRVISMTQDFADDPTGHLVRNIIAAVDEHHSSENAKHTLRAMQENARCGFWNGSTPPFGYRVVAAERRGQKIKKRLEADPREAEIVRFAFRLYLQGDGTSGPMGIKSIVSHLNGGNFQYRNQRPFRIQTMQVILRRTAYIGKYYFNRTDSRTRRPKDFKDWIEVRVPQLVDDETFDAVQRLLDAKHPSRTPARVSNSPTLLTGIAHCSKCGSRMRLRTGKSGRYRYYVCSRFADQGRAACIGTRIPMGTLDQIVLTEFQEKILEPTRLEGLLGSLSARSSGVRRQVQSELKALRSERRETEGRLSKLSEAIETGAVPLDGFLRTRITKLQDRRSELVRLGAMKERKLNQPLGDLSSKQRAKFADAVRKRLTDGPPAFRKRYVGLFINRVEVGDQEIRISGPTEALAAFAAADEQSETMVPTFVQDWRARRDSNPRPPD